MALSSNRWRVISPSGYEWERDALEYIRENLPDNESYRAWTNFEFISDDGSINEVDLLILTPCGFFLVEIKSRPGVLAGDAMTWVWKNDGKIASLDNPLLLANRKAKKLKSLIQRQKAAQKIRMPFLEPLVFCSSAQLQFHLSGHAANHICLHEQNPYSAGRKILDALRNGKYPGGPAHVQTAIDRPMIRDLSKAIEQAGIRQSQRSRRVGDYLLGDLLYESPTRTYQDWAATHASMESTRRRVRIYNIARNTSELDREFIRRAAQREFQLLEGIDHPGILKVHNFTDHELGPALILQHDPDAERLDHYLAQRGEQLAREADAMAELDPLLQADRAIERLRAVKFPASVAHLPTLQPALQNDARLLQLAVAASAQAALSARQEVYPRNMPALRALRLSHGGLVGAESQTPMQYGERQRQRPEPR